MAASIEMLPQEIIRRKRDGFPLNTEHIRAFVSGLTDGSFSEGQIAALGQNVILVLSGNVNRGGFSMGFGSAGTLMQGDFDAIRKEVVPRRQQREVLFVQARPDADCDQTGKSRLGTKFHFSEDGCCKLEKRDRAGSGQRPRRRTQLS